MTKTTIKFEGKGYFCDICRKLHDGQGYIFNGKSYCEKQYQKKFPLWKKEEK